MSSDLHRVREQLASLLSWHNAHTSFDEAVKGIPPELHGRRPEGLPYSLWELVEHMRLAQWDILDFCRNPQYVEPRWPADYWPETPAPPGDQAWETSLAHFRSDLGEMQALVRDPSVDLLAPIPHGNGQHVFREALLVADHNAYHVGQIVLVRRLLGIWPASG